MPYIADTEKKIRVRRTINLILPVYIDGYIDTDSDEITIYHASINGEELPPGMQGYLEEELVPDIKDGVM